MLYLCIIICFLSICTIYKIFRIIEANFYYDFTIRFRQTLMEEASLDTQGSCHQFHSYHSCHSCRSSRLYYSYHSWDSLGSWDPLDSQDSLDSFHLLDSYDTNWKASLTISYLIRIILRQLLSITPNETDISSLIILLLLVQVLLPWALMIALEVEMFFKFVINLPQSFLSIIQIFLSKYYKIQFMMMIVILSYSKIIKIKSISILISMRILSLTVLSLLLLLASCQYLVLTNAPDLSRLMGLKNNSVKVKASPIGFKPMIGSLHGKLAIANPQSACTQIQSFQDEQQDIFVLADDLGCVQSIKAHNMASSGAYIGIIKRNLNNTLHDKQIDLVHIPILEMEPLDFDLIVNYMKKNASKEISTLADFNPPIQNSKQQKKQLKKVNLQVWLSPNQKDAYDFIRELSDFIINQPQAIQFKPHFVFQAQASRKQYVGCLSSGRYCPPELQFEGRPQGTKVVSEALRQIIIAAYDTNKWLAYAAYYSTRCLGLSRNNLWSEQNSQLCSQNVMYSTEIDPFLIFKQYNESFQGPRPEVDGNTYLQQQHQLYLEKKLTKFPTILINNKEYQLQQPSKLMLQICNTYSPNPSKQSEECQKITKKQLFTWTQIIYMMMVLTCFIVLLTTICKRVMKGRMRGEIRGDVNNTLAQYYRYMETFQQPNPVAIHNQPNQMEMDSKNKSTQDQDLEMTQYKK